MRIHGLTGLSLLDFPGVIACTVFTGYCNFRCPFCHNAGLVLDPGSQPLRTEEEIFEFLKSRKGKISGVAITGGEPTLDKDLFSFIGKVKKLGLAVKLDTNGTSPDVIRHLAVNGMLDYIAMDIKAAPENYAKAVGLVSVDMDKIFESADLIMQYGREGLMDYEFRTTVVGGIHEEADFYKIGRWLKGAKAYFLQGYRDSGDILMPQGLSTVPKETMEKYRTLLLDYIPNTSLRGVI